MVDNADLGQALDWDDEIDAQDEFVLLDPGYYPFTVTKLEKMHFEGSSKIGACSQAKVTLELVAGDFAQRITDSMLLNTKMAWKITQFFESLGYQKNPKTGKIGMHWNDIIGKSGWVEISQREYTNKNGDTNTTNQVKSYVIPAKVEKAEKDYQARYTQPQTPAEPLTAANPIPVQQVVQTTPQTAPQQATNPGWSF